MTPTQAFLIFSAAALPLVAAEFWDQPAFPDWSAEVVRRLLTDSPWAKPLTVPFDYQPPPLDPLRSEFNQIGLPGGAGWPPRIPGVGWPGGGTTGRTPRIPGTGQGTGKGGEVHKIRTEVHLTIRWSSARPVREALAIEQWGADALKTSKAEEFLSRTEPDYVVEIFGLPAIFYAKGTGGLKDDLTRTAVLVVKGRTIKASSVESPEYGEHLSATLHFPRVGNLTADDGFVQFTADTAQVKITQKFKLKAMTYRGMLEL